MTSINSKSPKIFRQTKPNKKLPTSSNLLYTGLTITMLLCTYATAKALYPSLADFFSAASGGRFESTSIPWLNSKSECEYTGRYWRDNQCWDSEHQPMF
ncbi:hypothetical protein H6G49_04700 [Nostoc sp. PCC 7120 = FACHB-418]|uniref:Uncharacterized protein n=3 Tax=Nostocales TaxID=1161 RepID=A0A1Z4KTC8_ANAVA|nr:hypothetical protein [Anabaena cylindrica FACHB-318]MBD2262389.1 hypothetical protein [Anabaena sp. FACHB-709]MBD2271936.1 hypothetical protein [Nostoc sp. PCC 7120 = FACHB-418]MBD2282725.1 hypothetical protein [Anabaena cylindrica FACHB-170]MBD2347999.1 hypothetical protein [Trichormus variabilis FACHB-171]BAY72208.1 hypothetical protein NIES23_50320 [Trichormus variabilis NIES-23]HBW29136.1 hypothetical protein [Nostoc sp. UBA8866]